MVNDMDASSRPLRLLSLDGGGIRGISELVILNEIMHRVQISEKLSSVPLPADYFDLIGGTSTGGLIAILLGRLRLSVPEAIEHYRILAKRVFSEKKLFVQDGIFKASNLEKAIKYVIERKLGQGHAEDRMFVTEGSTCKSFVCAVPATNINKEPRLFRTWTAEKNPGYNCTIWEACRATSAAPRFFKRIKIGEPGLEEAYIDAGVGCNNPVSYVLEEASREFGPERKIGCIVSIGTGKSRVSSFEAPNILQRLFPLDLIRILASMATESDTAAKEMKRRCQSSPGIYHRLNVERGLDSVTLEEWDKMGEVYSHTENYIQGDEVGQEIDAIVNALLGRPLNAYNFQHLAGSASISTGNKFLFTYPSYRVDHFVPRDRPMGEINRQFEQPRSGATPKVVVLLGMGGCGKSQLALEYCQLQRGKMYSAILWVDATSPASVEQGFTSIATDMSMPSFDGSTVDQKVQFVLKTINLWEISWLFVFDNFDDPRSFESKPIMSYFPQGGKGSMLFTARHAAAANLGHVIDMSTMSEKEAIELLFRGKQASKSHEDLEGGKSIVKRLGFHALAVDQAASYIRARNLDSKVFLTHYNDRMAKVLDEVPELWNYRRKLEENPEIEKKLTVFTTWELSFALISGEGRVREDKEHLLSLLAFFDGKDVSSEIFRTYMAEEKEILPSCIIDDSWSEYEMQDILKELHSLSLIQSVQVQATETSISLHPLVQDWIKLRLSPESRRAFAIEASLVLSSIFESLDIQSVALSYKQILHNHLEVVLLNNKTFFSPRERMENINLRHAELIFGKFLYVLGHYKSAESIARELWPIAESLLGKEHIETLEWIDILGTALVLQDMAADAEPLLREVAAALERIQGGDNHATLHSKQYLCLALKRLGHYAEAESIMRSSVILATEKFGVEDIVTMNIEQMLASVLLSQKKYAESEAIYNDIIKHQRRILGVEHPDTLLSLHNLAFLLSQKGEKIEATVIYREMVEISERVIGKEHPDTLGAMENLAEVLAELGCDNEAESISREVVELCQKALGKEAAQTMRATEYLASFLANRKRFAEAESIIRETLAMRQKVLGKEHPNILKTSNDLAVCLGIQGRNAEAESLLRETLAMRQKVLGKEHPNTLKTSNDLAMCLCNQDRNDEAESLLRETLAMRQKVLGKEHPNTLKTSSDLAVCLDIQGRNAEAESLLRETLAMRQNVLGKEHPNTLMTTENLALVLRDLCKYDEAQSLFQELLATQERVSGKDHESTLKTKGFLEDVVKLREKGPEGKPPFVARISRSWKT